MIYRGDYEVQGDPLRRRAFAVYGQDGSKRRAHPTGWRPGIGAALIVAVYLALLLIPVVLASDFGPQLKGAECNYRIYATTHLNGLTIARLSTRLQCAECGGSSALGQAVAAGGRVEQASREKNGTMAQPALPVFAVPGNWPPCLPSYG